MILDFEIIKKAKEFGFSLYSSECEFPNAQKYRIYLALKEALGGKHPIYRMGGIRPGEPFLTNIEE